MSTLTTTIQHNFGSLSYSNQRRKWNKRNPDQKRSKTLTVCRWLILYIENPKDATRKLLELINEYSKISGHKINTQKSLAFLYTNNDKSGREIKETVPFTIATKRIKCLGINLPKETKDSHAESYKTLIEEIKDDYIQMERNTMFLDWKNQYSENDSTTQSNRQIQFSSYQTTRLLGS